MKKLTSILVLSALCFSVSPAFAQMGGEPPMDEDPGMGDSVSDSLLSVAENILDNSCTCEGSIDNFKICSKKVVNKLLKNTKGLLKMADESVPGFREELDTLKQDVDENCEFELEDPVEDEEPPMDEEPPL